MTRSYRLCAWLLAGPLAVSAAAKDFVVVEDGKPGEHVAIGKPWLARDGALACQGTGHFLALPAAVAPSGFTVTARVALEFNGTAAALCLDDNRFGFDSNASRAPFVEGPLLTGKGGPFRDLKAKCPELASGRPFTIRMACADGSLSIQVDDKLLWRSPFAPAAPVSIALRPHRALLRVYSFHVTGVPAGPVNPARLLGLALEHPAWPDPVPVDRDATIELPAARPAQAPRSTATLVALGAGRPSVHAKVDTRYLAPKGRVAVTLPARLLAWALSDARSRFAMTPFELRLSQKGEPIGATRFTLYDPGRRVDFPVGGVKTVGGAPTLVVGGQAQGSMHAVLARNSGGFRSRYEAKTVRQFARAGVNTFLLWLRPANFYREGRFDADAFHTDTLRMLSLIATDAPDARFAFHWQLYAPSTWSDLYPDDMVKLDTGVKTLKNAPDRKLQPSYASERWRKEAGGVLRAALGRLRASPAADRIAAVKLCYANCGEWNHWGYHEKAFVDFSPPMQRAFGAWLRARYKTVERLRQAWGQAAVTFDSPALVPSREQRMAHVDGLFRPTPAGRPAVDYYTFFQTYAVETIEHFARIVKEASDKRLLCGAYYGYYWGHANSLPYHCQDSGHYALARYLASPWLDFLGAPYPYNARRVNALVNGVFSSVALYNKVWDSEGDQRTHHSGPANRVYGTTDSLAESIAIAKRDFMQNLAKRASYYFFDFVLGWYQDPEFMATVAALRRIDRAAMAVGRESRAQVAVLVSEQSLPYIANQPNSGRSALVSMFTHFMDRTGAPWDLYLMSDLDRIDFKPYRFIVVPDAYVMSDERIAAFRRRVCNSGRTVLFLHAPAFLTERGEPDPERSQRLTGIRIAHKLDTPFTRLDSARKGAWAYALVRKGASPLFYVDDPDATVTAVYPELKLPGAAERRFDTHTAIVNTFPALNATWMRNLYRLHGVHVYTPVGYDVFQAAGPLLSLYSLKGGERSVRLPRRVEVVYDLFSGKVLGRDCRQVSLTMPSQPATVILYAGKQASAARFLPKGK